MASRANAFSGMGDNRFELTEEPLSRERPGFAEQPWSLRRTFQSLVMFSAVELTQAGFILRTVLYGVQEGFWLHKEARLDDGYWSTHSRMILSYFETAIARDIYRRDKSIGILDRDFVQWLDGALKQRFGE